jgi:hypothetical protein
VARDLHNGFKPMKKCSTTVALLALLSVSSSFGQISLTTLDTAKTENFNDLISSSTAGSFSSTVGTQSAIPNLTGWSGVKIAGSGASASALTASEGISTNGGLYSYGTANNTDRALGALANGTNVMSFGAEFVNNTGSLITSVAISFTSEFWRASAASRNTLTFAYGFSGGSATSSNYLTSNTLILASSLNVVGPETVVSSISLDGNVSPNFSAVTGTLTGLNWTIGQLLFIRWQDVNEAGIDSGLAIDDFSLTASTGVIPESSTYAAFVGLAVLAGVATRRRLVRS